jgi:DNA-binding HxlR family transcriptional regulator
MNATRPRREWGETPLRLRLLRAMRSGSITGAQLRERLACRRPTLDQQLHLLRAAGFVERLEGEEAEYRLTELGRDELTHG